MLKSSLYDYSDACILVKGTITVPNTGIAAAPNNRNKKVVFKICAPFTDYISEMKSKDIDRAKDIDVAMYNEMKYSNNYLKLSGSLQLSYRGESLEFESKQISIDQARNDGTKDVQIMVSLKY